MRIVGLFAVCFLLTNCSQEPTAACLDAGEAPIVDRALMAFLSQARAAHHAADAFETSDEPARAVAALQKVVAGPLPERSPEVREVLADTRARLADLESGLNNFASAERHIEAGLQLVPEVSYYRGHLFEIRGLVEERRARRLADRGDEPAAAAATDKAITAFERAMTIQNQVIREAVADAGKGVKEPR